MAASQVLSEAQSLALLKNRTRWGPAIDSSLASRVWLLFVGVRRWRCTALEPSAVPVQVNSRPGLTTAKRGGQLGLAVAPGEAASFDDAVVEPHVADLGRELFPPLWLAEQLPDSLGRCVDGRLAAR